MFENLKIRNRLGKAFRIIVTTCSHRSRPWCGYADCNHDSV